MKEHDFQTSRDLKQFFNKRVDAWRDKSELNLRDLAERCGVSPSYLSQIGRYGRVPGKPVLILLALNFELNDPNEILRVAGVGEEWPYPQRTVLRRDKGEDSSFLSVRLDMPALTESLRTIVRDEVRQQSGSPQLEKRALRIGLNPMQPWMYAPGNVKGQPDGFFHAFCRYLGASLQREVETHVIPFTEYRTKLEAGEIDLYGPVMAPPTATGHILYSEQLLRVGLCALMRNRKISDLPVVPVPRKFEDLKNPDYRIAVLQDTLPQLVCHTRLSRNDSTLVLCESDDEARDRLLLSGIKNAAHIFICNGLTAQKIKAEHPDEVELVFGEPDSFIDYEDITMAISPNLRQLQPLLNQTFHFLMERGGLGERLQSVITPDLEPFILLDSPDGEDDRIAKNSRARKSRKVIRPAAFYGTAM